MLELTDEQLASLAQIDARHYIEQVRQDLVRENAALANDDTLVSRLRMAYRAACDLGIRSDANVTAFLRLDAYSPGFYEKPAIQAWLSRPDRSADERFHDYLRVMKWRIEHPDYPGGDSNGRIGGPTDRRSRGGARPGIGARWRGLIGRGSGGGNG